MLFIPFTAILLLPLGGHAQLFSSIKHIDTIPRPDLLKAPLTNKPLVSFKGGYASYSYNYRSNIDTPFTERDISQHNVMGYMNVLVAQRLPLKVNYWIRRSNSNLFRDITDVQVVFDPGGFRDNMLRQMQDRLLKQVPQLQDSLLENNYLSKLQQLKQLRNRLIAPFTLQQLREYREIIQRPGLTYRHNLPDSVNKQQADSMVREAKQFIGLYDSTKQLQRRLETQVDSLHKAVDDMRRKLQQFKQAINGRPGDWHSYNQWQRELKQYQPGEADIPDKYRWLMGIRNMSLGKSPVNYSELTAKNIAITGVNFEYNSWYYLAVTAGVVDYRFRDFVVNHLSKTPQYLYMLRLGLGRLEKNYFIVSAFRGRKQLYASTDNSNNFTSLTITGLSAESKWQLNRTSYVIAEAAQSMSPDGHLAPQAGGDKFSWTNNNNKALSFKGYSYLPRMGAKLEGMYKFTGANYQSFSSYQTNAAMRSWYLKWEQPFLHRRLRITAALRSAEFSNPYIQQTYKSNSVFKSVSAVFKARRWPTITLGYVPMSQLTKVGQQLLESRFQMLTGSLSHIYKLGTQRASTMLVVNRFYNTGSDSGFVYFNATNIYCSQQFMFRSFSAGMGLSHSSNGQYNLNVLDGSLNLYAWKKAAIGFGVKVNQFDKERPQLGRYINANMPVGRKSTLYVSYEKGYLPGLKQLVANDMANVQLSKSF